MKKFFIVCLSILSISAFAQKKEEVFKEMKKNLTSKIDERIAHLEEAKSCVNAAADKEALKSCRKKMKENRKEMREDWRKKKQEWKNKRRGE